jgi:Fe-S oxidoreductase
MGGRGKIAYFAGCTANYIDPEIGKSTIQVLERQGFQPVFPDQQCCGVPQLTAGDFRGFLRLAEANVRSLAAADCDIVTACTSCALALRHDFPKYLKSGEAEEVSQRTYDVMEFLVELDARGELDRDFQPVELSVAYHAPCHLRALGEGLIERRLDLMRLIPGLSLRRIDRGCCGMGGVFGSKRNGFAVSMEIGQGLFEAIKESATDLVATDCPACQLQIEQGTGSRTTHLIVVVRDSYRL